MLFLRYTVLVVGALLVGCGGDATSGRAGSLAESDESRAVRRIVPVEYAEDEELTTAFLAGYARGAATVLNLPSDEVAIEIVDYVQTDDPVYQATIHGIETGARQATDAVLRARQHERELIQEQLERLMAQ